MGIIMEVMDITTDMAIGMTTIGTTAIGMVDMVAGGMVAGTVTV